MLRASPLCLMFFVIECFAFGDAVKIDSTDTLQAWCKNKSIEYYQAQQKKPHEWSASYWVEGSQLYVKGLWKLKDDHIEINCSARKGVSEKFAVMKINEVVMLD